MKRPFKGPEAKRPIASSSLLMRAFGISRGMVKGFEAGLEAALADIIDAGAGAGFEADDHLAVDLARLPGGQASASLQDLPGKGLPDLSRRGAISGSVRAGEAAVLVEKRGAKPVAGVAHRQELFVPSVDRARPDNPPKRLSV